MKDDFNFSASIKQSIGGDEYYSPQNVVNMIIPYIPKNKTIWCPICLAVNGYECGFADGVEEGKKQMLDEMLAVMHTSEFKDKWADAPLGVTIFDFVAEYFTPKGEKT